MRIAQECGLQLLERRFLPFDAGVENRLLRGFDDFEFDKPAFEFLAISSTRKKSKQNPVAAFPINGQLARERGTVLWLAHSFHPVAAPADGEKPLPRLDPATPALGGSGGAGRNAGQVFRQKTRDVSRQLIQTKGAGEGHNLKAYCEYRPSRLHPSRPNNRRGSFPPSAREPFWLSDNSPDQKPRRIERLRGRADTSIK